MRSPGHAFAVIFLMLVAEAALAGAAAPSVNIASPAADSVLLSRTVEVNGTAKGSDSDWLESTPQDLRDGAFDNIINDTSGRLFLGPVIYDDFLDGSLDPSKWSVSASNGVGAAELAGSLQLNGTAAGAGCWTSECSVLTTGDISGRVSAKVGTFNFASPSMSLVGMYQDSNNYIMLGMANDPDISLVSILALIYCSGGAPTVVELGHPGTPTVLELTVENGWSRAYVDGAIQSSRAFSLGDHKGIIYGAARLPGDYLNALWQNVSFNHGPSGNYTSGVYDTLSAGPVLKSVGWNATIPGGTGLSVAVRSADDIDMTDPTAWTEVSNGQNSSLPAVKQFLQYRVSMTSSTGTASPVLRDMNITYQNSVSKVETSVDNQKTWQKAQGAENWHAQVELAEGPVVVWVRVIDVLDNVQTTSVDVDVDTTPPTGWVSINGGANYVSTTEISLSLMAFDTYGVKYMMVSEDIGFGDTDWQTYTSSMQWNLSAGDGNKTIYVRYKDTSGWESKLLNGSIILDTIPPTGSVLINGGAAYANNPEVRLTLDAADESGVALMMVSNSSDLAEGSWQDYQPSFAWGLGPGDGPKNVWVKFRDFAGLDSLAVNASIILDTQAPALSFGIGDGGPYARTTNVTLNINATDNFELGSMMISSSPTFAGASWEPFSARRSWTFASQEGAVTLFAKVKDAAGNEAGAVSASVTLDTAPPLCIVSTLPSEVTEAAFTVRWNGSDSVSGIRSYDVQYKDGNGTWTGWVNQVTNTSAVFTGQDGRTYSFRARSTDNAGNVGAWPDRATNPVTVRLVPVGSLVPLVAVLGLEENATLHGKVIMKGTAKKGYTGRNITVVQLRIDDGQWLDANGTLNWTFQWNTAKDVNGHHAVHVRAYDGRNYSEDAVITVSVDNPAAAKGFDATYLIVAVVVIAAVCAGAGAFMLVRRKRPAAASKADAEAAKKGEAAAIPDEDQETKKRDDAPVTTADSGPKDKPEGGEPPTADGSKKENGPVPDEGSPAAASAGTEGQAALPAVEADERMPATRAVRSAQEHAQTLALVRGIHPGLPYELRGMSPEDLTQMVISGERGMTPSNQPIVMIMGRWYFGDEKSEYFLKRYNW